LCYAYAGLFTRGSIVCCPWTGNTGTPMYQGVVLSVYRVCVSYVVMDGGFSITLKVSKILAPRCPDGCLRSLHFTLTHVYMGNSTHVPFAPGDHSCLLRFPRAHRDRLRSLPVPAPYHAHTRESTCPACGCAPHDSGHPI
jgi:hypothetical protein